MGQDLIRLREQVMARAGRALNAAGPARSGDDYVREMRWAAGKLEIIAAEMKTQSFDRVEQGRTYCSLGGLYDDLEPALGRQMLLKAKDAYLKAEALLQGQANELERAKLDFNLANTLRRIDPNDIEQLQEAKQRFLKARASFLVCAPEYLPRADEALQLMETLLTLAPIANAVRQNTSDMAALQKELAAGGDVNEIARKAQKIMKRGGGIPDVVAQLKAVVEALPDAQKRSEKFSDIQKRMQDLVKQVLGNSEMTPEVKNVFSLLNEQLKSDTEDGTVSKDHAESLRGHLEQLARTLSTDEKSVSALLTKQQRLRELMAALLEANHYPSHGIERPPANSRAADLVELNWQIRRYLLEEMYRSGKGEEESREALELSERASRVDQRIYEAGADTARAMTIEKEELRPMALAVRNFSARRQTMPARPVWGLSDISVDTNAVFYSGSVKQRQSVGAVCRRLGLELMAEPSGESYAAARWTQLQKAVTTVFDLRVEDGLDTAALTYELGIALTLGKPVVVLVAKDQTMPFDVDINPVVLTGRSKDDEVLAAAIHQSLVWVYLPPPSEVSRQTLEDVLSRYPRPQQNINVDQTLRLLSDLRNAPDPLTITRALTQLFDFLKDGETLLIRPRWSPVYPAENKPRLFHVMPFRPRWANSVTIVTRAICQKANVEYIRGDEVAEPNVIRSIWEEIARATHVLVDLTGFNANVALELGIVHTLGKNVLIVGQGKTVDNLFPSVRRLRVEKYSMKQLERTLSGPVGTFIGA